MDFDEFLRKRNEAKAEEAQDTIMLLADQSKEWQRLKDQLRQITAGKSLGTDPFEWSPYPSPYPDFLKLRDVAVIFAIPRLGTLMPQTYRVVFARRPLRANEVWIDDEPISAIHWLPILGPAKDMLYWEVKEQGLRLPTPEFAVKIAERLVEYFDAYTAALQIKYPGASF